MEGNQGKEKKGLWRVKQYPIVSEGGKKRKGPLRFGIRTQSSSGTYFTEEPRIRMLGGQRGSLDHMKYSTMRERGHPTLENEASESPRPIYERGEGRYFL